jgi:hypothetical protein
VNGKDVEEAVEVSFLSAMPGGTGENYEKSQNSWYE